MLSHVHSPCSPRTPCQPGQTIAGTQCRVGLGSKSLLSRTHLEEGHSCTAAGGLNVFEEVRFILEKKNSCLDEQGQWTEPALHLILPRHHTEDASIRTFLFTETAVGLGKGPGSGAAFPLHSGQVTSSLWDSFPPMKWG